MFARHQMTQFQFEALHPLAAHQGGSRSSAFADFSDQSSYSPFVATLDRGHPVRVPYCEAEKRAPEIVRGEVAGRGAICRQVEQNVPSTACHRRRHSGLLAARLRTVPKRVHVALKKNWPCIVRT